MEAAKSKVEEEEMKEKKEDNEDEKMDGGRED